jgi:hypothetical protein
MSDVVDEQTGEVLLENWEFTEVPTATRVLELLATLPPVFGVSYRGFADFVQPLPQKKKITKVNEKGQKYVDPVEVWHLYFAIAGRVKMLQAAAEVNDWRVDFQPEKHVGGDRPRGYLETEPKIVYREYVRIYERDTEQEWRLIGSRPGTAHVPRSGGSNAAGTNPYEKVETSARGRAIAAWGIGVLPGSGIASLEEMQDAQRAEARDSRQGRRNSDGAVEGGEPVDRQTVLEAILTTYEQARQLRGYSTEESVSKMRNYIEKTLGIQDAWDEKSQTITWSRVKPGQLAIMHKAVQEQLKKLQAQEEPI